MPMNKPAFTTRPERIARLEANYAEGLSRETIPTQLREELDKECLVVSDRKLMFLFQNAMEGYSSDMKNAKVREFNDAHASSNEKKSQSFRRYV